MKNQSKHCLLVDPKNEQYEEVDQIKTNKNYIKINGKIHIIGPSSFNQEVSPPIGFERFFNDIFNFICGSK